MVKQYVASLLLGLFGVLQVQQKNFPRYAMMCVKPRTAHQVIYTFTKLLISYCKLQKGNRCDLYLIIFLI